MKRLLVLALGLLVSLPGLTAMASSGDAAAPDPTPNSTGAESPSQPAVPPSFTLTMIQTGNGDGSTTPASGPAPGMGHVVAAGVPQSLKATPAQGSVFAGWSGDLPAGFNPRENTLFLIMDRNRTITAAFMPAQCTLTVRVSGTSNAVNMTPAPGAYDCLSGQELYINALPADGSPASFVDWSGDVTSKSFSAKVVMNGDKTVTANYTDSLDATRQLVVNPPQGAGAGTYFPLGPGTYRIAANSILKFGANPLPGGYFGGWLADYAGINMPQELNVTMDQDHAVGAAFSDTGITLTVILEGEGDLFPRTGSYAVARGLQVPFTAQRTSPEWYFDSWRDGSEKMLSDSRSFTFTVNGTAPATIKGVFVRGKKPSEVVARVYFAPFGPYPPRP